MSFRFIHTADIHLDSPLKSLALRNSRLAEVISNATRSALVGIIDLCVEEKVDALLIAGDLYDGEQKSVKTARFLAEQLERLAEQGIRVFIIRGNHDAESKITKEFRMPPGVHLFKSKAGAVELERPAGSLPVVVHGISFKKPKASKSLLPQYAAPQQDAVNIGMMHTSLEGSDDHNPYAPCKLSDLQASGYDYWALGHIHKRFVHETEKCTVVMPGIPQGRDIGEAGTKSVTLVSIAEDRQVTLEARSINIAQFEKVSVDLDGHDDWDTAIDAIGKRILEARSICKTRHLVARVILQGSTPLSWKLRREANWLAEEIKTRVEASENCWIDKIVIECQDRVESLTDTADPLVELAGLITEEIRNSTAFSEQAREMLEDIQRRLPSRHLRDELGTDEAGTQAILTELALSGAKDVLSNLRGDSTTEKS